jgi:type III pantothenate kinase
MSDRSSNWLIDLGNTRLKWTRADDDALRDAHALSHVEAGGIDSRLDGAFTDISGGTTAWLASVAGDALTTSVIAALERRGTSVQRVRTQSDFSGVRIAYAEPTRLGVDRFLALVAAHARGHKPWLIVSVGTALTLDLLGADGIHHGGLIAPSPALMRESLAQRAPQLPEQGGVVVDFATDTLDALASGSTLSARALVERSLHAAARRIGAMPTLLLSGGGAAALDDATSVAEWPTPVEREPHLVLHGLRLWAQAQAG